MPRYAGDKINVTPRSLHAHVDILPLYIAGLLNGERQRAVAALLRGKGVEERLHLGRTPGLERAGLAHRARRLRWRASRRAWGWAGSLKRELLWR